MASYDFSTLSSSDLEELVCDLLNAEQPDGSSVHYRLFKDGRDKGVDFLYSTPAEIYAEIGQVKHYYRTGFDGLFRHLQDPEKGKVVKLNPGKYLFATSVDLTIGQAQQILALFEPHMKSLSDVYGKKNINQLVSEHQAVLNKHFKLWFSDTSVLQKLLSAEMYYRTADFLEHELTRRMRLFVPTPMLETARLSLEKNHFVLITGDPGVGKSTLAEMLVYEKLKDNYEFLYIHSKVEEAEKFLRNDDSLQLIYFDDFLGSNAVEINRAQGSEATLIGILRRVKRNPSKRLIFTTRVHILNTVIEQSEKLERIHIRNGETLFNLEAYDTSIKEQLLRNHFDESDLDYELKAVLNEPDMIAYIVGHRGFNPRSVEFITSKENVPVTTATAYRKFIRENFENPTEIWRKAYQGQIGQVERWLLNTLLTFDTEVEFQELEAAFNKRLDGETAQEINAFRTALVRLDRGFINIKNNRVDFRNPSLKDFLVEFLATDRQEIGRIVGALRYIQQYSPITQRLTRQQQVAVPVAVTEDMMVNFMDYTRSGFRDHDIIRVAAFIQNHISDHRKDKYLVEMIEAIGHWESLYEDYALNREFTVFLEHTHQNYEVQDALLTRTSEIVNDLVLGENDVFKAVEQLEKMSVLFQLDFSKYDVDKISDHLDDLFAEHILNEIDWLLDEATDPSEISEKMDEVRNLVERLAVLDFDYEVNMDEFKSRDWDEITRHNDFKRLMAKDD